jgi:hypothetical protein
MNRFQCPECQNEIEPTGRATGQKARCPECGKVVVVPQEAERDTAGDEWHDNPAPAEVRSGNRELLEWLGITSADLLVYLSAAAVTAMFFVRDQIADAVLAAVGVLLAVAACPIGMKRDPRVSDFTNGIKAWAYPACVILAIGAVIVHYARFND